jgi:hypothetical protein
VKPENTCKKCISIPLAKKTFFYKKGVNENEKDSSTVLND